MLKKKKTSLILASLLMLSCTEIMLAQPYPSSSYEINEGYRRLVKWTGPETNIDFTADPYLKEYVEDIWSHAFDGNENITSLKFSSTLTEIHFNSFGNCPNLETVEFSEEGLDNSWLTIQSYAFSNCPKLKSVILPKRLTHIGKASFDECPSLISFTLNKNHPTWKSSGGAIYTKEMDKIIKFPQGITGHLDLNGKVKTIGEGAFYGTMLSSIFIPSVETIEQSAFERSPNLKTVNFPNTLRCINSNAFGRCKMLKNMILPSSLETIDYGAFYRCTSLPATIKLPASLSQIDGSVFCECPVQRFEVAQGNPFFSTIDGVLFDVYQTELVAWPYGREEKEYTVPEGVNIIREYSFDETQLESVNFPSTLQTIKEWAFELSKLKRISLPEGLRSIEAYAFGLCEDLVEIVLPSTLNELDKQAFERNENEPQRKVTCYAESPAGGWQENQVKGDILYVPEESIPFYQIAPGWRAFGTINAIPEVQKFPVTFSYTGDGLIFVKIGEDEIESGAEVVEGTELTIVAFPFTDNEVGSLQVNGVECKDKNTLSDSETVQITLNVTEPVDILGTFVSSIEDAIYQPFQNISQSSYFTLDGRKLDGVPTKKGIYMVNGRKYVKK